MTNARPAVPFSHHSVWVQLAASAAVRNAIAVALATIWLSACGTTPARNASVEADRQVIGSIDRRNLGRDAVEENVDGNPRHP